MTEVYIGVGSNIEPEKNTRLALDELRARFGEIRCSTIYESRSVGFDGDNFLNCAIGLDTELSVPELATELRNIEVMSGRERGGVNGDEKAFSDRTLDLDILLFGDDVGNIDGVELPRTEITEYPHVLFPLADLAGDRIDPATGRSYSDLRNEIEDAGHRLWPARMLTGF